MVNLTSALAVTADYRNLQEFHLGLAAGWFIPDDVREQARQMMQELTFLRTLRDNQPIRQLRIIKASCPALAAFAAGRVGWFVPKIVRDDAAQIIVEIDELRRSLQTMGRLYGP